jgi:hypothetical protein
VLPEEEVPEVLLEVLLLDEPHKGEQLKKELCVDAPHNAKHHNGEQLDALLDVQPHKEEPLTKSD